MPVDVNLLRTHKGGDPELVRASERKRRSPAQVVDDAMDMDRKWVVAQKTVDDCNKVRPPPHEAGLTLACVLQERNRLDAEINSSAAKKPTEEQRAKSKELGARKKLLEEELVKLAELRDAAILKIGNVLHGSAPDAAREEDLEVCVTSWGEFASDPDVVPHHQALWMIGGYEPEKGSAIAGHRGYYLTGPGVMLNQALISYALGFLVQRQHTPVMPPYFMTKHAMSKVSQLSDFDESLYHVGSIHRGGDQNEDDDKYLIATSEQPLCCLNLETQINPRDLPIKYAGFSTCFRKVRCGCPRPRQ
jgi:seryl-tRNA synthetase